MWGINNNKMACSLSSTAWIYRNISLNIQPPQLRYSSYYLLIIIYEKEMLWYFLFFQKKSIYIATIIYINCVCVHIHDGGRIICIEETQISFESLKQHPEINHKT